MNPPASRLSASPVAPETGNAPLLEIDSLAVAFHTPDGIARALNGVSLALAPGRTLGLVGESGCGKSATALAVMGLLPMPPAQITGGQIRFQGRDLLRLDRRAMRDLRGNRIAMIFQEPMTSLNPAFTIGDQIAEAIVRHRQVAAAEARRQTLALLRRVHIPAAEQRLDDYPHRLSGGMRQRVMIAMALACNPSLLIADEPTTALDVTIQAQILDLLRELRQETGMAILLITHDLGVVAELADQGAVMYSGRIVEQADVASLLRLPEHPYTVGLLGAVPKLDRDSPRLVAIEGMVPDPLHPPPGCSFAGRCPFAEAHCREAAPPLAAVGPGHVAACWRAPLSQHVLGAPA